MIKTFLTLFFFLIIFQLSLSNVHALSPAFNRFVVITFCNKNSTNWHIAARYRDATGGVWIPIYSSQALNGAATTACPGGTKRYVFDDQRPDSGDYVQWYQACVDPNTPTNVSPSYSRVDGGIYFYDVNIDVSCHGMGYNGTPNKVYAGCYNNSYGSRNWGDIASGAQCPYLDTNDSYCTAGGVIGEIVMVGFSV